MSDSMIPKMGPLAPVDPVELKNAFRKSESRPDGEREGIRASIVSTSMREAMFEMTYCLEQARAASDAWRHYENAKAVNDPGMVNVFRQKAVRYEAAALKTAAHVANLIGDAMVSALGRNVVEKEGAEGAIEVADFLTLSHLINGRS